MAIMILLQVIALKMKLVYCYTFKRADFVKPDHMSIIECCLIAKPTKDKSYSDLQLLLHSPEEKTEFGKENLLISSIV